MVLLDGENPVYNYSAGLLNNVGTVVSFGGFLDDSSVYADFILPDHHTMESELAVIPPVAGTAIAFNVTEPFVRPLYNTRAVEQTLADIAKKMNLTFSYITEDFD